MPYFDERSTAEWVENQLRPKIDRLQDKCNELTATLYGVCTQLEKENHTLLNHPMLADWWKKHKAWDVRRKANE